MFKIETEITEYYKIRTTAHKNTRLGMSQQLVTVSPSLELSLASGLAAVPNIFFRIAACCIIRLHNRVNIIRHGSPVFL